VSDLTVTELRERLDLLLAAERKILSGQSYQIGDRRLQRADHSSVAAEITQIRGELRRRQVGRGGRLYRGVPR